jgi:hypothetical protein
MNKKDKYLIGDVIAEGEVKLLEQEINQDVTIRTVIGNKIIDDEMYRLEGKKGKLIWLPEEQQ